MDNSHRMCSTWYQLFFYIWMVRSFSVHAIACLLISQSPKKKKKRVNGKIYIFFITLHWTPNNDFRLVWLSSPEKVLPPLELLHESGNIWLVLVSCCCHSKMPNQAYLATSNMPDAMLNFINSSVLYVCFFQNYIFTSRHHSLLM